MIGRVIADEFNSARDWPDNNNRPPVAVFTFATGFDLRSGLIAPRRGAATTRTPGLRATTGEDFFAGTTLRLDGVVIMNSSHSDT